MKFNVSKYITNPTGYVLKTKGGEPMRFIAWDPESKGHNVITSGSDGEIRQYSPDGVYLTSGEESILDLTMEEIAETFEYEGYAYVVDGDAVVGLHLPTMRVNHPPLVAKAHRCIIKIELYPVTN